MEGWAVVEYVDFGQREDCPYWRGVVVHHAGFSGDDAQEKAKKKADVLRSKGLNVVVEKVPPLRPSLPYQGIARRVLDYESSPRVKKNRREISIRKY